MRKTEQRDWPQHPPPPPIPQPPKITGWGTEKLSALNKSTASSNKSSKSPAAPVKDEKLPKKPVVRQNPFTFEPATINESDEKERISSMAKREFLIHSHGLLEKIYEGLKQAGQLRLEDEIKFGRSNKWDLNDRFGQMYDSHKKQFNESITSVLKCISKKSDIRNPDKAQLSSIFLDPPLMLQGDNVEIRESHLGPFGDGSQNFQEPLTSNDNTMELNQEHNETTKDPYQQEQMEGIEPIPGFTNEHFIIESSIEERKHKPFNIQQSYLSVSNS